VIVKKRSLEERCPNKPAREAAWKAIDNLAGSTTIGECVDTWMRIYIEHGGVVRQDW